MNGPMVSIPASNPQPPTPILKLQSLHSNFSTINPNVATLNLEVAQFGNDAMGSGKFESLNPEP